MWLLVDFPATLTLSFLAPSNPKGATWEMPFIPRFRTHFFPNQRINPEKGPFSSHKDRLGSTVVNALEGNMPVARLVVIRIWKCDPRRIAALFVISHCQVRNARLGQRVCLTAGEQGHRLPRLSLQA